MNLKWKLALMRRFNEKGFVIPTIVGLGLIMILIGITMVVLSHDNQLTASSQKKTSEASNVAEAGVAEVLSFLSYKSNRLLAKVDLESWEARANWSDSDPNCSAPEGRLATDFIQGSEKKWVPINPLKDNPVNENDYRDRYKILKYIYNSNNKTGTLIIQAESNYNDEVGKSSSVLQVTIPVSNTPITNRTADSPVPALWLKDVTPETHNLASNKVRGNILIDQCPPLPDPLPPGVTEDNVDAGEAKANKDIPFPSTPELPTSNLNTLSSLSDLTLPRDTDLAQADGSYAYLIKEITGTPKIIVKENKKVVIYVQGKINLSGAPEMNKDDANSASQLQLYGNTKTGSITTKYGCADLILNTNCPTLEVKVNGNGLVKALIHAPDATAEVLSHSDTLPRNFVGAIWVRRWNQQTSYSNPNNNIFLYGEGDYNDFVATKESVGLPAISAPSSWQRCSSLSTSDCQQ